MDPTLSSVANALNILHLLRRRGPLRLSEISRELNLGASTTHRLVSTLRQERFVVQEAQGKLYALGPAMLYTASMTALEHCVTIAIPIMNALRDVIEETIHLSSMLGRDTIFLAAAVTNRHVRVTSRKGQHPLAHTTAAGKVLLAELQPSQLEELFPEPVLTGATEHSIVSRRELFDVIDRARGDGYARNVRESEDNMYTIAVPVLRPRGVVSCALAISSPYSRVLVGAEGSLSQQEGNYLSSLRNAKRMIEDRLAF